MDWTDLQKLQVPCPCWANGPSSGLGEGKCGSEDQRLDFFHREMELSHLVDTRAKGMLIDMSSELLNIHCYSLLHRIQLHINKPLVLLTSIKYYNSNRKSNINVQIMSTVMSLTLKFIIKTQNYFKDVKDKKRIGYQMNKIIYFKGRINKQQLVIKDIFLHFLQQIQETRIFHHSCGIQCLHKANTKFRNNPVNIQGIMMKISKTIFLKPNIIYVLFYRQ